MIFNWHSTIYCSYLFCSSRSKTLSPLGRNLVFTNMVNLIVFHKSIRLVSPQVGLIRFLVNWNHWKCLAVFDNAILMLQKHHIFFMYLFMFGISPLSIETNKGFLSYCILFLQGDPENKCLWRCKDADWPWQYTS